MPTAVCDLNTINQNSKCFQCLSELENQAIIVYFLEQTRAKLAGVTPRNANQLRQASSCLACIPTDPVADGLDSAVAQAGAIGVGDTASAASIAAIRKATKALANTSLDDLRSMEVLLRCQLNAFLFVS